MKTVATIEARMASTRLPGKVMLCAAGTPMLGHVVRRLQAVTSLDAIVLATTDDPRDDVLAEFAASAGIDCFRGSDTDVMGRVIGAARSADAELVVEITADCPILDPGIVEQLVRMYHANDADYVSNTHVRSFPDGMDAQVFRLATLERSAAMTSAPLDREHVTLHIRNHPEPFPALHLVAPPEQHWPELGLTLDEPADYELLERIIEHFGDENPLFTCLDVVRLLRAKPEWSAINRDVRRKGDT